MDRLSQRVPLRPGDADARLDLAAAYALTYDGGPFDVILPYDRPLPGPPPLT